MLSPEYVALKIYLRDQARQQLGPGAQPFQYAEYLALIWNCSVPDVIKRLAMKLHAELTVDSGATNEAPDNARTP